jgi:hypoxanthine phosphoribosyltransferase
MTPDFPRKVLLTVSREGLLPPGSVVVAGISGGADSTALLAVLVELRAELALDLSAAHFDHALRPDSGEDARFARELAHRWNVPFRMERAQWGGPGGTPAGNTEAAARDARYSFLNRCAEEAGGIVAVGHTANDRLETFLERLLQGAGPGALAQPRYRRDDGVIRPLLDRDRAEVEEFLREKDLPWISDPTNAARENLRSRIRHDLVPLLLRENPRLTRAVGRTSTLLAEVDAFLETSARDVLSLLTRRRSGREIVLDAPQGRAYHPLILRTVLREAAREVGDPLQRLAFEPLDELARAWLGADDRSVDLPGRVRVVVGQEEVGIARTGETPPTPPGERELRVPGRVCWPGPPGEPGTMLEARLYPAPPLDPRDESGPTVAWVDADRIATPLEVRQRRDGDRYRPVGLEGSTKVQDLLVDRKVPRKARDFLPVVCDGEGIVWVPGFRIAERVGIGPGTVRGLRLESSPFCPVEEEETRTTMPTRCECPATIGTVLFTKEQIRNRVREMGRELSEEYEGRTPILINILKGGFIFLADLVREMEVHCETDFMVVSSYEDKTESSGVVRILSDLVLNIEDRDVLIVEDIVDTGLTLDYIRELLLARNPSSLKIVSLLDKHEKREVHVPIDLVGFRVPDEFVVGYGLDYAQRFRNLPYITILSEEDLDSGEFPRRGEDGD